jgi:hypothetical protein
MGHWQAFATLDCRDSLQIFKSINSLTKGTKKILCLNNVPWKKIILLLLLPTGVFAFFLSNDKAGIAAKSYLVPRQVIINCFRQENRLEKTSLNLPSPNSFFFFSIDMKKIFKQLIVFSLVWYIAISYPRNGTTWDGYTKMAIRATQDL